MNIKEEGGARPPPLFTIISIHMIVSLIIVFIFRLPKIVTCGFIVKEENNNNA